MVLSQQEQMDILPVQEIVTNSETVITALPVVKMALNQTPRLPLTDLKQNAQPYSVQKTQTRMIMPLHTPNGKKAFRKIQPSTLVFQEEKENENVVLVKRGKTLNNSDVTEDGLEEFIEDVMKKCVEDVEKENWNQSNIKSETTLDKRINTSYNGNQDQDNMNNTQYSKAIGPDVSDFSDLVTKMTPRESARSSLDQLPNKKVTFDESILEEEILLADTSHDESGLNDSCINSTKSEEELLAFTPVVGKVPSNLRITTESEIKAAFFKVKTPKFNFQEQADLTRRIRKATHSLESFLVHKEDMVQDLQIVWKPGDWGHIKPEQCDAQVSTDCTEFLNKSVNTEQLTPEKKPCHSISCSPMPLSQQDISIQNVVDVNSVFCSPMPVSCHDASTQNETETLSTLSSPIRIPGVDSSIQAVVETKSVMCTPIRIPVRDTSTQHVAETQSTLCSPMPPPPVMDVSTQNEVETQSVMCSPMVPKPSHDKSILVSGPELVDLCVGTDVVTVKDEGVSVQPDTTSSFTEMDDLPMISCGTAMTPLKVVRKQGKKLTADDIRKQHPRVLANELETLKAENHRLETQVQSLEERTKQVVSQEELLIDLQHTRSLLEDERDLYWKDFKEWKTKCEQLEVQNETMSSTHKHEISDLKDEYENNDYYGHFLSSQKVVTELQAELQQYKELLPNLEQSQKLMEDLKKQYSGSFMKLKSANQILNERKTELDIQEAEIKRLRAECDIKEEKNKSFDKEREELSATVSLLQEKKTGLEEELKSKNTELLGLLESNSHMQSQLVAMATLEKTLDDRDSEIDMLEKDLFECREVICTQIEERKVLESQLIDVKGELNREKKETDDLKDGLARLRGKEQEARAALSCVQEELSGTKEHASRIIKEQGTEITDCSQLLSQLATQMAPILEELKRKAGMQIDQVDKVEEIIEINCKPAVKAITKTKSKKWRSRPSFVSQILQAVGTSIPEQDESNCKEMVESDSTHKEKQNPNFNHMESANQSNNQPQPDALNIENESHGSQSRKKLVFSSNSAFAPINAGIQAVSGKITQNDIVMLKPYEEGIQEGIANSNTDVNGTESREGLPSEDKLSCHLTSISQKFQQIVHVSQLVEKALRSSIQDIRSENYELNSRISQSEYSEKRARAQLELAEKEVESSKKTIKQQKADIEEMSDRFEGMLDRKYEGQKEATEREIRILRSKILSLEGERDILSDQFNEILQKVQSSSQEKSVNVDVHAQREIIILKKQADKYRKSIREKDEMIENERTKASQQALQIENNWKKADAEVLRLYELIDRVRTVLVNSKNFMEDPKLQKVVRALDGLETNSRTVLKPIKTSWW